MSRSGAVAGGYPLNLTGAVQPTRYVGGTAAGAPTTGTFAVADFVVDQQGTTWVCTLAGSPGTWAAATGQELAYASAAVDFTTTSSTLVDVPSLSIGVTVGSRPILVEAYFPIAFSGTAGGGLQCAIVEGTTVLTTSAFVSTSANAFGSVGPRVRLTPSAGSHTYKIQAAVGALGAFVTGTLTLKGGATFPQWIRAVAV